MWLWTSIVLVAAVSVATFSSATNAPTTRRSLKYAGMTFTNERYCPNVSMSSTVGKASLAHLATTGANFVSVIVTQYQDHVRSTDIYPIHTPVLCNATPGGFCVTATDREVNDTIAYAHTLGLSVMLKLQVDLIHSPIGIWRGDIGTNMTEVEWAKWFESYRKRILHYAAIAEAHKVKLFSVSCELVTASHREHQWREVVKQIRSVYSGTLTDAANWAPPGGRGEVTDKKWWDAVDVIGIDEYFVSFEHHTPYANGSFPSLDDLLGVWATIEPQFEHLHKRWNKTILFTEIGFCSGVNGTCYDDGATIPTPAANNASIAFQATQYEATLQAMSKYDWWEGVFWWNWASDAAFGGPHNSCMDPKFKPAEDVLRQWYGATSPKPKRPSYPPVCQCWL